MHCELGIICLDNTKTRKFVNGIDSFLDFCIVDEQERRKWKHCISEYKNAMLLLHQKCDLTNNDIKKFQQHVDTFYVSWIDLLSHEGITNYIHMLGAGHIGEYLLHHRNLYKHSQQGWEAFNSLLKTFFLSHWQRRSREQGNWCQIQDSSNSKMAFMPYAMDDGVQL